MFEYVDDDVDVKHFLIYILIIRNNKSLKINYFTSAFPAHSHFFLHFISFYVVVLINLI